MVVGGRTVEEMEERRYGINPDGVEVDGGLVVVEREESLKGSSPVGAGVEVDWSCLLYLLTLAVAAGSQTGQLSPVSRQ